jgi:hypothetical protein
VDATFEELAHGERRKGASRHRYSPVDPPRAKNRDTGSSRPGTGTAGKPGRIPREGF